MRKKAIYAREHVRHVWLVAPIARTLEVFRLDGAQWIAVAAHGGNEVVRAEPFEAAELSLVRWWPDEEA